MTPNEDIHFEKITEDAYGIRYAVSLCSDTFFCDISDNIEDVTCKECLKKYIKEYIDIPKHQLILCHEKKVRDLQLHIKKIQRDLNIHTQRERLRGDR